MQQGINVIFAVMLLSIQPFVNSNFSQTPIPGCQTQVSNGQNCPPPQVSVVSKGGNSITYYVEGSSSQIYYWYVNKTTYTSSTVFSVSGNSITISGLTVGDQYEIYFKNVCGDGNVSEYIISEILL